MPPRWDIPRRSADVKHPDKHGLIKTLGSVAMPAYSHLLDEERDQIAVMRGRPAARSAPSPGRFNERNPPYRGNCDATPCPAGYSPLHAAGAYQLRRRREAILEKDPTLRTFVRDRLAEGWAPEQIAGWLKAGNERGLRALGFEAIYALHLSRRPQGRGPLALSDAPPQTPSSAPIKAFARYHQGSRFHPPTAQEHRC